MIQQNPNMTTGTHYKMLSKEMYVPMAAAYALQDKSNCQTAPANSVKISRDRRMKRRAGRTSVPLAFCCRLMVLAGRGILMALGRKRGIVRGGLMRQGQSLIQWQRLRRMQLSVRRLVLLMHFVMLLIMLMIERNAQFG